MPNIAEQTTKYLVENANQSTSDFTPTEILDELKIRIVADDDPDVAMRGGIHPIHAPTH